MGAMRVFRFRLRILPQGHWSERGSMRGLECDTFCDTFTVAIDIITKPRRGRQRIGRNGFCSMLEGVFWMWRVTEGCPLKRQGMEF